MQTDDSKSGSAARLESLDTKGVKSIFGFPAVPKVTSGSVFNGFFKVETDNTLRSTRFGDPCDREPKSFTSILREKFITKHCIQEILRRQMR